MGRYAIFNGLVYGGGTNVIPNPEGTPTEELHSIQIDEDIYEIVGGGGSGGNASLDATILYDTPITSTGTYTLADDYNNYDFIGFKAGNGSTETDIRLYAVKDIQDSMNDNLVITNNVTNSWFNFTINENELTIPGKTVSTIYSVIGYKIKGGGGSSNVEANPAGTPTDTLSTIGIDGTIYDIEGSSGGGSSFVMDELYAGTSEVPSSGSTVSLSKSIDNYDFIMFDIGQNSEHTHQFFTPDSLYDSTNQCLLFATNSGYCDVYASTSTELTFGGRKTFDARLLYSVYGLKFGSGGSGSQEFISYDTTITTTQYGWWTAEDKDGNVLDPDQYELIAVSPIVNNSSSWVGAWDGAFYVNSVDGTTYRYDVTFVNINDGGYIRTSRTWDIKVVYRDKNAAGGGGGSTVVPNPEEEPTDTLNTIEIDGVVYDIEGGSEGGQGLNPANYSIEEEVIGVWTNNLPVYKKTWTFTSAITVRSGSWADTSISVSDTQIHTIVNCEAVGPNGQAWTCISATTDEATQTYVRILNTRDTDVNVKHLTLYYIKDGDSPIVPPGTKGEYNYYGGFIDTNNIIQSKIVFHSETSYTATENCAVIWSVANNTSTSMNILIDGVMVAGMYADSIAQPTNFIFLKKNQTITFQPTYSPGESSYTVYGIMYDNEKFIDGEGVEIYSEDEYIVGKWIDGKKLYQKTFYYTHNDTIGDGYTTIASLSDTDYFEFVECSLYNPIDKRSYALSYAYGSKTTALTYDNGDIKLRINNDTWNANWDVVVTVRYTKTVETPAPSWGGSVTNNYAGFIDTSNVIDSGSYQGSFTYTATEDCFVNVAVVMSANDSATITIDGELVTSGWCASLNTINPILPLKKGQTLVATASASNTSNYTVYGITYASGGSSSGSSKIEYSTEEKEIGTWIDGSKIYQKTFVLTNLSLSTSWVFNILGTTGINIIDFDGYYELQINGTTDIQKIKCNFYDTNNYYAKTLIDNDGEDLTAQVYTNAHSLIKGVITIQYTKTTT